MHTQHMSNERKEMEGKASERPRFRRILISIGSRIECRLLERTRENARLANRRLFLDGEDRGVRTAESGKTTFDFSFSFFLLRVFLVLCFILYLDITPRRSYLDTSSCGVFQSERFSRNLPRGGCPRSSRGSLQS